MKQLFLEMNEYECSTTYGGEIRLVWIYKDGKYREVLINE